MHINSREVAIGGCISGFIGIVWFMRNGEMAVIAWNALPYLLVMPLALLKQTRLALIFGLSAMLAVDVWMMLEASMEIRSGMLLIISVLSSAKLFVLFPVGFVVGLAIARSKRSASN